MIKILKMLTKRFLKFKNKNIPIEQLSETEQIERWRSKGIKIGENCHIYSMLPLGRDCFLLNIGDNVTISSNVTLLFHDASVGNATRWKYTDILGEVFIGNNCFLGWGAIILPGVSLAEGTIVGAGSVVTKSVEEKNMVIAGNPAQIICSVNEFIDKNTDNLVNLDGLNNRTELAKYLENNKNKLVKKKYM